MQLSDFKKVKKQFMDNSRQLLVDEFKGFFDKHPEVKSLRWTQYTPHFNDGDVCEFNRHDFDVQLTAETDPKTVTKNDQYDRNPDDEGYLESWDLSDDSAVGQSITELCETFEGCDDLFKAAFGDGVQVTASRKGFKVDDYDHD